jgi:flotillin
VALTFMTIAMIAAGFLMFVLALVAKQYKRCPSNRILVIYGKATGSRAARCIHGGGSFVIPLIQDYAYLSLEPLTIGIELNGALSKKNIRVNVPSTFTIGISTDPTMMFNAAERLLGLSEPALEGQARDIILGQLRLVIATLSIEEINQDREKFLELINQNVNTELNKIGVEVINVNIRDITDESGYIQAIGKKAAAEAINKAKVEVAQQEKDGAIGESTAVQEKEVQVADQQAKAQIGQKRAEREQRITIAQLEAEGVAGEVSSKREQDIAIAEQNALTRQGQKKAEQEQRVFIATQEAEAVKGENTSKAQIADYNAMLSEKEAEAARRAEIATAEARRDILRAEKEREVAMLEKEALAKQEVEKRRIEVQAEAFAEQKRREAKGEADAILMKYEAEAEGIQKVLGSKAHGYEQLMASCGDEKYLAPTLMMVEQLPQLIEQQVKAVQNLKIDKITVWDSPTSDGNGSTANFLKSLVTSVPPLHGLAKQVGVELPEYLGALSDEGSKANYTNGAPAGTPPKTPPSQPPTDSMTQ